MVSVSSTLSDWVTASVIDAATSSKNSSACFIVARWAFLNAVFSPIGALIKGVDLVLLAETLDELMQRHIVACVDELLGLLEVGVLHHVLQIAEVQPDANPVHGDCLDKQRI